MNFRRDVYQAISDPTRRAILVLLASQSMSAGTIASHFNAARPTISKHIQILSECELVIAHQQGRNIYYQLRPDKMQEVDKWLEQFRKIWDHRFSQLDSIFLTHKKENK